MDFDALVTRFKRGQVYLRKQIHMWLGGQEQGGISTPRRARAILLFSTEQGADYGYRDGWRADGFYHYTGEGQSGDMQMVRGNRAIRDHQKDNKALMLFEGLGSGLYRFEGFMNCVDYCEKDTDALGNKRRVFVFRLMPIDGIATVTAATSVSSAARIHSSAGSSRVTESATAFLDLRPQVVSIVRWFMRDRVDLGRLSEECVTYDGAGLQSALQGSLVFEDTYVQVPLVSNESDRLEVTPQVLDCEDSSRTIYQKCIEIVKDYVLARANGFCELCGHPAPFVARNGRPYLEVHYIGSAVDYGLSEPNTLIALCPACHREAHHGIDSDLMANRLLKSAMDIETALDRGTLKMVTAAVIHDEEGRILAAQRAHGEFAGFWEFPGGQVKQGETLMRCVVRELSEELALQLEGLAPLLKVDYDYETFFMRLFSFTCRAKGRAVLRDHTQIRWIDPGELASLSWVSADETIVAALCDGSGLRDWRKTVRS
jgi:5-methylcytosine-specific restriction protein A